MRNGCATEDGWIGLPGKNGRWLTERARRGGGERHRSSARANADADTERERAQSEKTTRGSREPHGDDDGVVPVDTEWAAPVASLSR